MPQPAVILSLGSERHSSQLIGLPPVPNLVFAMDNLEGLSQLVLDTRLETQYTEDIPPHTLHLYPDSDPDNPQGDIPQKRRLEKRGDMLEEGALVESFGRSECVQGRRVDELRAVKEIFLTKEASRISKYQSRTRSQCHLFQRRMRTTLRKVFRLVHTLRCDIPCYGIP